MPNRDRAAHLLAVAVIVGGIAVLSGVVVFPILLGWPVGFGLFWYRTEVWATIALWVTAGVALAAAIFALNQLQEARRTRERQTQPNVVVYADLAPDNWHWLDVIVRNFGQTSAFHVRMHFDPWPTVVPWEHPVTGERVSRLLLPNEIPVLAPGQEWRTSWEDGRDRMRAESDLEAVREMPPETIHRDFVASLPDDVGLHFEGWVEFEDSEHRRYRNPAVLDLHMFFDMHRRKSRDPASD